jgi:hypothetical protein
VGDGANSSDNKNDKLFYIHLDVYPDSDMPLMVDFSTAASHNAVCIADVKLHIMIKIHNCSIKKDESYKKYNVFCHDMNYIGFLIRGKLVREKSVL